MALTACCLGSTPTQCSTHSHYSGGQSMLIPTPRLIVQTLVQSTLNLHTCVARLMNVMPSVCPSGQLDETLSQGTFPMTSGSQPQPAANSSTSSSSCCPTTSAQIALIEVAGCTFDCYIRLVSCIIVPGLTVERSCTFLSWSRAAGLSAGCHSARFIR